MNEHATHPDVIRRLKRASGHLQAVIAMIEAGRPCPEVAQQLQAVVRAVDNAKTTYIQDHIEHCIDGGVDGGPAGVRELVQELKDLSKYL